MENTSTVMSSAFTGENATNMTNTTVVPKIHAPSLYPYEVRALLACFWIFFTVMGLVGSNLVIWSVILSKKLRTVTNAFVVNLSVADLVTSLSYPWMAVAGLGKHGWPLGTTEAPCQIAAVLFNTGLGGSLFILAGIAVNRLMIVTQSADTYSWLYTPGKVAVMIAATWIAPCLVLSLPPILGAGSLGFDNVTHTCSDMEHHPESHAYNLIQTIGLYPLPVIIIIGSYTALYVHIRRHFKEQRRRRVVQLSPTTEVQLSEDLSKSFSESVGVTLDEVAARSRRTIKRQQLAITKNLFLVCCVFTVLVSPYYLSLAADSDGFSVYGAIIATVNSCVNPIIYTANHPQFKIVLRKMILCRYSEIPEPSDFLKYFLSRRN